MHPSSVSRKKRCLYEKAVRTGLSNCMLGPQLQGISRLQLSRASNGLEEQTRASVGLEEQARDDCDVWVPQLPDVPSESLVLGHTLCYFIGMSVAVNAFAKVRLDCTGLVCEVTPLQ